MSAGLLTYLMLVIPLSSYLFLDGHILTPISMERTDVMSLVAVAKTSSKQNKKSCSQPR